MGRGAKDRTRTISAKLSAALKSPNMIKHLNVRIKSPHSRPPAATTTIPLSLLSPIGDLSMRGGARGGEDSPSSSSQSTSPWSMSPTPPPSRKGKGNLHGATARDGPNPDIEHLIKELTDVALIRTTNRRVKAIASQIRDVLLSTQRPFYCTDLRPGTQETLRQHGAIMAELIQEFDNREKSPKGRTAFDTAHSIAQHLVDHWDTVMAVLLPNHPKSPSRPGLKISIPHPSSSLQAPVSDSQALTPLNNPEHASVPTHLETINNRLVEQDHIINGILSLLQTSEPTIKPNGSPRPLPDKFTDR